MGKVAIKQIRAWRIQAGMPLGLHVWFDPAVEHMVLLEGPDPRGPMMLGEDKVNVDTRTQHVLPWKGTLSESVSGQREAFVENLDASEALHLNVEPLIPF